MKTAEETALLMALLLKRSEQTRARISEATIRKLSGRRHIRSAFISMLLQHLDDLGLNMSELDRGGYGLIKASVLEGAPAVTAKKHLLEVLAKLDQGKMDFDDVREELQEELDDPDDDE
jgi:hypothetical protein